MSNYGASSQDYGNTDDALLVMPEQFEELQQGEQDASEDEESK